MRDKGMGDCGRRAEGQDKGWVKGRVKGEQGAEQGAGLPMGVPPHHLQKHNKGRDFRWESHRRTCKSTIKELKRQHTSKLAEEMDTGCIACYCKGRDFRWESRRRTCKSTIKGGTSDGSPAVELAKAQ